MQLIVALYTRQHQDTVFTFTASLCTTQKMPFIDTKEFLLAMHGEVDPALNRIVPAKTLSELPDIMENLNVA